MSKWVQHISGQGEKWEVQSDFPDVWRIMARSPHNFYYHLPKSEYRECDPPEEWADVTGECDVEYVNNDRVRIMRYGRNVLRAAEEHRVRKVQVNFPAEGHAPNGSPAHCGWAFIVERKKP